MYSRLVKNTAKVKFQEALGKRGVLGHHPLLRTLVVILGVSWNLWQVGFVGATANMTLTPANIEQVLLNKGWKANYAKEFSQVHIEYKDLSNISAMAVTYERTPWNSSPVYIDPVVAAGQIPEAIEHELHHLADWRTTRRYEVDNIKRDYFSLGTSYRSVEVYSHQPVDYFTVIHYNHDLIASLGWDYTKLPNWYNARYFYYADTGWLVEPTSTPRPTSTPTPTPMPKPTSTPLAIHSCVTNICSSALTQRAYIGLVVK